MVIKFEPELVAANDPLRGHSIVLFTKIYGDRQSPADAHGQDADHVLQRPELAREPERDGQGQRVERDDLRPARIRADRRDERPGHEQLHENGLVADDDVQHGKGRYDAEREHEGPLRAR